MLPHAPAPGSANFLSAADPARLFVIGGMLLVIAGMIFGDLYAIFILHPNVADIGREMGAAVTAAAAGDADSVFIHFGAVGGFLENAGTKKDAHVHIIHAGFLAFLLAFLQPWVALETQAQGTAGQGVSMGVGDTARVHIPDPLRGVGVQPAAEHRLGEHFR